MEISNLLYLYLVKITVGIDKEIFETLSGFVKPVFRPCIKTSNSKFYNRDEYMVLITYRLLRKTTEVVYACICMCTFFLLLLYLLV